MPIWRLVILISACGRCTHADASATIALSICSATNTVCGIFTVRQADVQRRRLLPMAAAHGRCHVPQSPAPACPTRLTPLPHLLPSHVPHCCMQFATGWTDSRPVFSSSPSIHPPSLPHLLSSQGHLTPRWPQFTSRNLYQSRLLTSTDCSPPCGWLAHFRRTKTAAQNMEKEISSRSVRKEYLCRVSGAFPRCAYAVAGAAVQHSDQRRV